MFPSVEKVLSFLVSLQTGRQLKEVTKQEPQECQKQLTAIDKKPQDLKEAAFTRLHHKKQQEESKLLKLQKSLEVSQNKLKVAEEQLRCAKAERRVKKESVPPAMSFSEATANALVNAEIGEIIQSMTELHYILLPVGRSVRSSEHAVAVGKDEVHKLKREIAIAEEFLYSIEMEGKRFIEVSSSPPKLEN